MQNVVNYIVPFFRNDGKPISAGRVFFCSKNTSARKSSEIQPPDLIAVKDKDGSLLQNPLPLDDSGRFTVQPFVDYDVDFKMYVDEPTSLPPLLDDDSPCWNTVLVMSSFDNKFVKVEYSGMPVVGTLAQLRWDVPVETPAVLVLGYNEGDTFCPPRVFKFVAEAYEDNGGNHIRSQKSDAGTWVCDLGEVVDVRIFGINPKSSGDYSTQIEKLAQDFKSSTLYFPAGDYYFSKNINFGSVIMESGANFRPNGNVNAMLTFDKFENRGGRFFQDSSWGTRIFPVMKDGVLRTSWLGGNLAAFIFKDGRHSGILSPVKTLIFDDENIDYGSFGGYIEFEKMAIVNYVERTLPNYVRAAYIVDYFNKTVTAPIIKSGGLIINDNRILYGSATLLEFDEESGIISFLPNVKFADVEAEYVHAKTLKAESVNIQGVSSLVSTDDDYTLSVASDKHKAGDVVIVHNTEHVQRKVYMRTTNDGTEKRTYCTINADTALMFFCTLAPSTGFSQWSAMSNVATTTEA